MGDDAIREDVSQGQVTEDQTTNQTEETQTEERFDPRKVAIDAIAEKLDEERMAEMGLPIGEDREGSTTEVHADDEVELLVSGEKRVVPKSQVLEAGIRTLQKDAAADKKLEEASILLREVREEKERLSAVRQLDTKDPTDSRRQEPDTKIQPDDDDDIEVQLEKMEQAIRYGSEEEAREALRPFLEIKRQVASTKTAEADPRTIYRAVDERLTQAEIIRKFSATPEQGGFADINQHPYLRKMAAEAVDELIKTEGKSGLDWSTYEEAGKRVREQVVGLAQMVSSPGRIQNEEEESRSLSQKVERKRKIDNVFGVGVKDAGSGVESSPPESSEAERQRIINEIRQARGQPI
jgi:hypothetical protein